MTGTGTGLMAIVSFVTSMDIKLLFAMPFQETYLYITIMTNLGLIMEEGMIEPFKTV